MSVLKEPVLVLNKVWMKIRIITVKRALKLIFADRASIISGPDFQIYKWKEWSELEADPDEKGIQTVYRRIKLPIVITLGKYDKVHRKSMRLTKQNIYRRDKYVCQYTGKRLSAAEADLDHIIPRSQGGRNSWNNLVVCSKEVNRVKADRTPEEAGLRLIKRPQKPTEYIIVDPKIIENPYWENFK